MAEFDFAAVKTYRLSHSGSSKQGIAPKIWEVEGDHLEAVNACILAMRETDLASVRLEADGYDREVPRGAYTCCGNGLVIRKSTVVPKTPDPNFNLTVLVPALHELPDFYVCSTNVGGFAHRFIAYGIRMPLATLVASYQGWDYALHLDTYVLDAPDWVDAEHYPHVRCAAIFGEPVRSIISSTGGAQ